MADNQRLKLLIIVSLSTFSSSLMGSSINIALPDISREFNIGAATLPWIATAFTLMSTIFLLPGGRLADIYGRRRVFIIGLSILTFASIICALSSSELMLILSRGCQGMGHALLVSPGTAIIVSAYPVNERGKALGIYLAAIYLGLTLGPLIGGILTEQFGWRSLFLMNIPIGLFCLFMFWQMRRVPDKSERGTFDITGWIISGISIIWIIYGLTVVPSKMAVYLLIAGFIGIAVFIWWEKKTKIPLLNINLFRENRVFAFSNLAALINYSSTNAIGILLSLYIQYIKGYSPQNAGLILAALPLIESIFSPLAGRWSDRFGSRNLATIGMVISTLGLAMLYFIGRETSTLYIIIALLIAGFGLALFVSPNSSAIMSSVPGASYGVASATLSIMRQVGMMLSLGFVTVIFSMYIGPSEITPQYYPAFLSGTRLLIGVFTILSFLGIFASYARGNRRNL